MPASDAADAIRDCGRRDHVHSRQDGRGAVELLVWNSPRREGVLPAGDTGELERDVVSGGRVAGTRHVFPESEETGLGVCPGLKRRELELGRRRFHRKRST